MSRLRCPHPADRRHDCTGFPGRCSVCGVCDLHLPPLDPEPEA